MKQMAVLGIAILLAACTKEVPYKEAPKDEQLTKQSVNTSSEFVYMVSNGEASRTSPASRPFWMGSEKLVKFQWTENSLQVLELDRSNLFRLNPTNNKVVLEIPVTHSDYQCAKDQFGECTNQEEENQKISWKDRSYFRPKLTDMKVTEISLLPVELQNFFDENCYQETNSRLLDYEFTPEAVNIRIERTFKANLRCLDENAESLSDAVFSSVYHYSMVRLDKIASPNYQAIDYPQYDEDEIGFFNTQIKILDPDNRDVEVGRNTFLNRWNPDKSQVVYYLNKNFFYPQNRAILAATKLGIDRVNLALSQANSKLQIVLKDGSKLQEGDLRNSFIILVDDPLTQNVIGYGPSAANPLTGEILSGRVVMYAGTMKKFIRTTYEEFVQREKEQASRMSKAPLSLDPNLNPQNKKESFASLLMGEEFELGAITMNDLVKKTSVNSRVNVPVNISKVRTDIKSYTKRIADRESRMKDRLEAMSEHCAYPAELVNFEQAVSDALKDITNGQLLPWTELPEAQKALIVDAVIPFVWVPTLVHEFGHNLGLRHNFAGSEDEANFYSQEELAKYGVDHGITYSSVMDYPHRSLNELPAMGKYDIAALRFAYAREVEVEGQGIVAVPSTLKALDRELQVQGASRKPYKYCTDEHASVNPGCKRFDEGTSFSQIAQNFVDFYNKEYRYRHLRNGAANFSLFQDISQAERLDYTFNSLRIMFEIYERLNSEYNIPDELWEAEPFLKDIQTASDIAVNFFVETLKTPDLTCAFSRLSNPSDIVGVIPLEFIDGSALTCFDENVQNTAIANKLLIVGEGGRSFNSKKDPRSENHFGDQIDKRGIWIEKALAMNYIYSRGLDNSIFDKYRKNLTSYPRYAGKVLSATIDTMLSNVVSVSDFELIDGSVVPIQFPHSPMDTQKIPESMDPRVKQLFGLPNDALDIDSLLLKTISNRVPSNDSENAGNAQAVSDLFEVFSSITNSGRSAKDFESTTVGPRKYFALKENIVALMAIRMINAQRDLGQLEPQKIEAILERIKEGKAVPGNATPLIRRIYKMDPELIEAFLQGSLKDENFLGRLLSQLPSAI